MGDCGVSPCSLQRGPLKFHYTSEATVPFLLECDLVPEYDLGRWDRPSQT